MPAPSPERLLASAAAVEHAQALDAGLVQRRERAVVSVADVLGLVRVRGERDRQSRVEAQGEQLGSRIDLPDRLAKARGRDLDRDVTAPHALERQLVETAQLRRGRRARTP